MEIFTKFIVVVFIAIVSIRTIGFGLMTWSQKNKTGAIALFLLALTSFGLPVYALFIKDRIYG